MLRPRIEALLLPSGRRVGLRCPRPRGQAASSPLLDDRHSSEVLAVGGRLLAALDRGDLVVEEPDGSAPATSLPSASAKAASELPSAAVLDWPLPDFHALRDVAGRLGIVGERLPDLHCRNCDALLGLDPRQAPVDDLDTWYASGRVDAVPIPPDGRWPLPRPVRLPTAVAHDVTMRPVRVREARRLWRAIAGASDQQGTVVPASVGAVEGLGLVAVGPVRTPRRIARVLADAPEDVWATIETAFVLQAYAPEGARPVACARCGAIHDVDAPLDREVVIDPDVEDHFWSEGRPSGIPPVPSLPAFPAPEVFADRVVALSDEVFDELGVAEVDLHVDYDVPPVDTGGEPLLGSYRVIPDVAADFGVVSDGFSVQERRFRIELYYETFRRMYDDAPYDVDAEIRETLAHEVEHHLYELAGYDPMDAAERAEARREVAEAYGPRHLARATRAAEMGNVVSFLRVAVPLLALAAAVAAGVAWFLY